MLIDLGPVLQKPINANPLLKVNRSSSKISLKANIKLMARKTLCQN